MFRNSVDGRLNRNTFCSGTDVARVQCSRGLNKSEYGILCSVWAYYSLLLVAIEQ